MKRTEDLLDEVKDIVRARGAVYGSSATNHRRISELWSGYLDTYISPEQASMCMLLVKVSRLSETYTEDSVKDIIGYACVYNRIIAELRDDNTDSDNELL